MDIKVREMHNLVNVKLVDIRRKHNLLTMVHKGILEDNFAFNMVNHERNTRYNDGQKLTLLNLEMRPYVDHVCMLVPLFGIA